MLAWDNSACKQGGSEPPSAPGARGWRKGDPALFAASASDRTNE